MTEPIAAIGGVRAAMVEMPLNQPMQATVYSVGPGNRAAASGSSGIREAVATMEDMSSRMFAPQAGGPASLLAGVERSALSSITPRDYLRTSLAATDLSMHVSMSMMKFHLSASLGSSVTGLFNTLLKNRD